MEYPQSLPDIIIAIFASIFTIGSLFSMGKLAFHFVKNDGFDGFVAIGIGFGINHLLFLIVSLFLKGPSAVICMNILHALSILMFLLRGSKFYFKSGFSGTAIFVILLIITLPYLFQIASPPMNIDGLSFYLPNTEWVYHRGLSFNPHLTNYTTMPMACEYLFAQAYGMGGRWAVLFTDTTFGALTLFLCYRTGRILLSPIWTIIFILTILLFPQGILYLLGAAKVDMVNTFLLLSAISLLFRPKITGPLVWILVALFSISCAIKYLSWLQLIIPISVCILYIWNKQGWRTMMLACLIPLFFTGPVLLKNQLQVGNPLAPLVWNAGQHTYIAAHQGIDLNSILVGEEISANRSSFLRKVVVKVYTQIGLWLYAIALILLIFARLSGLDLRQLKFPLFFLLGSLIPWHAYVGTSLQPTRFTLPLLILLALIIIFLIMSLTRIHLKRYLHLVGYFFFVFGISLNLFNSYVKHGHYMTRFWDAQKTSLKDWYASDGKYQFAMTQQLVDEGWLEKNIMFLSSLNYGLVPFDKIDKVHTDFDLLKNQRGFQSLVGQYDYVFCRLGDREKYDLMDKEVIIQVGNYFLLKR
jgi:hypothetical protein